MSSSGAGSDASEGPPRSTGATGSSATNPPARPALAASIARPMVTAVQLDQRTMEMLAAQVAAKMREGVSGGSVPAGSRSAGPWGPSRSDQQRQSRQEVTADWLEVSQGDPGVVVTDIDM